jgi:hypothetical protein
MAESSGVDFDEQLAGARVVQLQLDYLKRA